ncbi:hypothetical protein FHETE_4392 [Fusarium heterosporum]|uniref:2EXR domain-containing protein n=1 Tax=Fusarium heterosporum TaxID=42747 RepID=A0A8H5TJH6_FUSHE|nr:hypothetical protein FHETE_4392 [Fusarium heterosporum]
MALQEFHLFSQLPREIRSMIYMLATPPRVVHIQERTENYNSFVRSWNERQRLVGIDPALMHFARNWASHMPSLESNSSMSLSDQLLSYVYRGPATAWHLIREGYIYSNAPIPSLLHTCRESRAELKHAGYALTFRTRSAGPRTWFNYTRDHLYLEEYDPLWTGGQMTAWNMLTNDSNWDYGQLNPDDMQKVRKLVLATTAISRKCWLMGNMKWRARQMNSMTAMVEIFGGVEEVLFFEPECGNQDIKGEDLSGWAVESSPSDGSYVYSGLSSYMHGGAQRPCIPGDFGLKGRLGWIRRKEE